jgi:hyaluronan synthase
MYTFWWQVQDWLRTGTWHIFAVYFVFVWAIMLPRSILGRIFYYLHARGRIQHYPDARFRVSALVTEYKEDPEDFERCLSSLRTSLQEGTRAWEIIVLLDGVPEGAPVPHNYKIAEIYATRIVLSCARNKRRNLRRLVGLSQGDILLLVDSDTTFEPTTVYELCKPFSDPVIGGTTTAQRIYNPHTFMQRMSDWMENARLQSSMATSSLFAQVACLPGRAIAIRKKVVRNHMTELVRETFGFFRTKRPCISGDDRFLTNVILRKGYNTVLVPTARVTTLAPEGFIKTSVMWTRWGRSSQRYTMQSWWLFRYPIAACVYWSDIILAPATVLIVFVHWPYSVFFGSMQQTLWEMLVYALGGSLLSMSIRQMFHLIVHPRDWWYLPGFVLIATYLQVVRTYALITLWKVNVWGTRKGADKRFENHHPHFDTGPAPMIDVHQRKLDN